MGGQKRAPGHRPLRNWANPVGSEDGGDRRASDAIPQVLQGTLDPAVAPRGILPRHPEGQVADFAQHAWSSHTSSLRRPFTRDKLAVPPQDGVWRTSVATSRRACRPRRWPFTASRRRWASVSRRRRPSNCSLRTRFSSRRYSMTSSWWRFPQPARVTSTTRSPTTSTMDRVYSARASASPGRALRLTFRIVRRLIADVCGRGGSLPCVPQHPSQPAGPPE